MPRLQSRPAGAAVVVFGALMALQCSSRVTVDDPRPVVSVQELMENIFDPFGDTLFDAVGFDVTPTGVHDVRPETDEDWARLRQASVAIAEGTNLLKIHPRPLVPPDYAYSPEDRGPGAPELAPSDISRRIDADRRRWNQHADGLRTEAAKVLDIVNTRNVSALFDATEALNRACERCHLEYWYPGDSKATYFR